MALLLASLSSCLASFAPLTLLSISLAHRSLSPISQWIKINVCIWSLLRKIIHLGLCWTSCELLRHGNFMKLHSPNSLLCWQGKSFFGCPNSSSGFKVNLAKRKYWIMELHLSSFKGTACIFQALLEFLYSLFWITWFKRLFVDEPIPLILACKHRTHHKALVLCKQ